MQKKKILFFLNSMGVGGAERMTVTAAKSLDSNIYDIKFVLVGRIVCGIDSFIPSKYEQIRIRDLSIWDFVIVKMLRVLVREKPDVVFCSQTFLNWRLLAAVQLCGKNIKTIVRSNCKSCEITGFYKKMVSKFYPLADMVVVQTEAMERDFTRDFHIDNRKCQTLHNLLDVDYIDMKLKDDVSPYIDNGKIKYVNVGRVSKIKGQDVLLQAFGKLYEQNKNIELYFVGRYSENSEYYKELRKYIQKNSLSDVVHFVGFQDNPYKWERYADCFVLSSRSEASPNALFEAMYIGVPVISTSCTENISDIIQHEKNGYIVPVCDIKKMMDAMNEIKKIKINKGVNRSNLQDWIGLFD